MITTNVMKEAIMRRSRSRKPKSQRRIETSGEGRISFRPGGKHPLDVQFKEARLAKEQLDEQLALFAEGLDALSPLEGLDARISVEEEALRHFLSTRYQDYFHQDHIEATFLWLRRKRAIARLQAAQAALNLIQELLAPDTFVDELQALLRESDLENENVDRVQLTGNAQAAREQLAQYDARLQEIRTAISRGNGWIEQFYITKLGFKPAILALAYALWKEREEGKPVSPEVLAAVHPEIADCLRERKPIPLRLKEEATTETAYGPYYKYRWREGNSPIYTISLGRLSDRPEYMLPFRPYIRFSKE
jgi:hypothetical protein